MAPDASRIAVGYGDNPTVGLFSGSDLGVLPRPETGGIDNGSLSSVAWSADGRTLFAGGRYQMPELNLEYGGDDARAVGAALAQAQGGLFERVEVRVLPDAQATRAGIRAAFAEQAAKTGPDDVFLLFLAGHGLALDGRYLFLPWDLVWTNAAALRAGSLDEETLRDLLAQVQARKVMLLLDSCYSASGGAAPRPRPTRRPASPV